MLSLMVVVVEGSLDPSRLMISFLSRRERPFLIGALGLVGAVGAGAGLAEGGDFFFFFLAT